MRKRVLSLCMVVALCLSLLPVSVSADEASDSAKSVMPTTDKLERTSAAQDTVGDEDVEYPDESGKNCHEMTELWFGNTRTATLLEMGEISTPEAVVSAYFSLREADYPGERALLFSSEDVSVSETVREYGQQRAESIQEMQKRLNMTITDAEVTLRIDQDRSVYNEDGTVILYAYEWTFFDYDDLSNGVGGNDVSGYGTEHKITLSQSDDGYQILSDEYDESDLFGICALSDSTQSEMTESGAVVGDTESVNSDEATLLAYEFYSGYDPVAATKYADDYVYHDANGTNYTSYYNSAYRNFNPDGGDCANYASQCIRAGGMPMDNGWYYYSSSNYSTSWV